MTFLRIVQIVCFNVLALMLVPAYLVADDKLTADEIIARQADKYDAKSELEFVKIIVTGGH